MSEITKPIFLDETGQAMVSALQSIALITSGFVGAPGSGVPTGGSAGQILVKASSSDYDTQWANGPVAATSSPLALGSNSSVGTSLKYAREDHVHQKPTLVDLGAAPAWDYMEVSDDGSVQQDLEPYIFYDFTGTLSSLSITLWQASDPIAEYHFRFNATSSMTFALQSSVIMPTNFEVDSGIYELDIIYNGWDDVGYGVYQNW